MARREERIKDQVQIKRGFVSMTKRKDLNNDVCMYVYALLNEESVETSGDKILFVA